jgi:hypothetical protein
MGFTSSGTLGKDSTWVLTGSGTTGDGGGGGGGGDLGGDGDAGGDGAPEKTSAHMIGHAHKSRGVCFVLVS